MQFTLTVICRIDNLTPKYTASTVFEIVYAIRSPPVLFSLPEYTWKPAGCKQNLIYTLVNTSNGKTSTTSFPKILSYDKNAKTIQLAGGRDEFGERDL